MTYPTSTPRHALRLWCLVTALLLVLPLLGGCFPPLNDGTEITLPEAEEHENPAPVSRKRGAATTKTGTGLDLVVEWQRSDTDLGEAFSVTAFLYSDSAILCTPDVMGTIVINDQSSSFTSENIVVDRDDPVVWRLLLTTKTVYVNEGQHMHVIVTFPIYITHNGKEVGDLIVEFDA